MSEGIGAEEIPAAARSRPKHRSLGRAIQSIGAKLVLLLIVFASVPVILYAEFRQADWEKRSLLLDSVRAQGRLIAESLRPLLEREEAAALPALSQEIKHFATGDSGIKVLYRPAGEAGGEGFFFVASEPSVPAATLDSERKSLAERGVLEKLSQSCKGDLPIALRHRQATGQEELLTSITPVNTQTGCWAVVTTHNSGEMLGTAIDKPYWQTVEVRLAGAIYVGMAAFTVVLFLTIWRGLLRFRAQAEEIRAGRGGGAGFSARNEVPELAFVAEEFDRMTLALQESAHNIRLAAEDNAHAFKTPIAILRQSIEPLKRIVPPENARGRRALEVIEESVDRLDHLVSSARQLDQTTAELLDPPRQRIDLSRLLGRMLEAYAPRFASEGIIPEGTVQPDIAVNAGEDLIETVIENVIDNAIEAAPRCSAITVDLRKSGGWVRLTVSDRGPGLPEGDLERVFERYVSLRGAPAGGDIDAHGQHLGIGLWIVRRNLQAVGGDVRAENRDGGGLSMILRLPAV